MSNSAQRAISSAEVYSGITTMFPDLYFRGVSVGASTNLDSGKRDGKGIGQNVNRRRWFSSRGTGEIRVDTIFARSVNDPLGILKNATEALDLLGYYTTRLGGGTILALPDWSSVLREIVINATPNQALSGSFASILQVPSNTDVDYIMTQNVGSAPVGTGSEVVPLIHEDLPVIVDGEFVRGASSASVSCRPRLDPVYNIGKLMGYLPSFPLDVDVSIQMYEETFGELKNKFLRLNPADIEIGPIVARSCKYQTEQETISVGGYRTTTYRLKAKSCYIQGALS